MATLKTCLRCGMPLVDRREDSICPKCLLAAGLKSRSAALAADDATVDFNAPGGGMHPARTLEGEFGDYEILRELARGGMGVVYVAIQKSLNRTVALKMILSGQLADEDDVQRFRAEAEAAANLQHPSIVAIHDVGVHQGQHYFSMELVDGESLAELVRRRPLSPRKAAEYVLAITNAIAYAHGRGIVHRDLKPSNVLIDANDQPRVTDFGLAKRIEAGSDMTVTGQAVGTPSYMPPEQVSGRRERVGPTSDIYSIGAILYELLTGRPPFQAESPLATLLQVLDNEPAAPRLLNSAIPKDLQTICLKCLEKDPHRRYASAADLSEDLRRFLNDESVHARPIGPVERSWRWVRRQRRSVAFSATAAVATMMLSLLASVGWFSYQQWRLGHFRMLTDRPPIIADLLDDTGNAVRPPFIVPTPFPIAVPADEYVMRLASDGRLSHTYRFDVFRGDDDALFRVNLEDQLVWPTLDVSRTFELIELDGATDVILLDDGGISRRRGESSAEALWRLDLQNPDVPVDAAEAVRWPWAADDAERVYPSRRPRFVKPAPDVDNDGVGDLVIAAGHQAWVMAISGATGSVIWLREAGHAESSRADATTGASAETSVGAPSMIDDIDGDGIAEFVATFAFFETESEAQAQQRHRVEVISGKSGTPLWTFDVPTAPFAHPLAENPPLRNRWYERVDQLSDLGHVHMANRPWNYYARLRTEVEVDGIWHPLPDPAVCVRIDDRPMVVVTAATNLIVIDAASGDVRGTPDDLRFRPALPPIFSDVDRDGSTEIVLVELLEDVRWTQTPGKFRVHVRSLSQPETLWTKEVEAYSAYLPDPISKPCDWPQVADLNGDERPELLIPTQSSMGNASGRERRRAWGTLQVLDAATGEALWSSRLPTMDQQINNFIVGADIDGDGYRDVFVATLHGSEYQLFVDALSGATGEKLWWTQQQLDGDPAWIGDMQWWNLGSSGGPRLLVPVIGEERVWKSTSLYLFGSKTGKLEHVGIDMGSVTLADADGDAVEELYAFQPNYEAADDRGGKLSCLRNEPAGSWRRLGASWMAGQDYNGDGNSDLLRNVGASIVAISATDGRKLWKAEFGENDERTPIPVDEDLNGDGVPDVLAARLADGGSSVGRRTFPLDAISGSDGSALWTLDVDIRVLEGCLSLDCCQLDGVGSPEIIVASSSDWDYPWRMSIGSPEVQHAVAVVNGHNGTVRWKQPLSMAYGNQVNRRYGYVRYGILQPAFADLDDDGILDIVLAAEDSQAPTSLELRALSGRNGSVLWRYALPPPSPQDSWRLFEQSPVPTIADIDADGVDEVLLVHFQNATTKQGELRRSARIIAVDSATGSEKWSWQTDAAADCGRVERYPEQLAERPMPYPVQLDRSGRSLVCVNLWGDPGKVIVLDDQGGLVRRADVHPDQYAFRFWPYDVNGDGTEELVIVSDDELRAVSPHDWKTVWARETPGRPSRVKDILDGDLVEKSPGSGQRSAVVLQSDFSIYGISASDGRELWAATSPTPRTARGPARDPLGAVLMKATRKGALPRVVFELPEDMSVCRPARSSDESTPDVGAYARLPSGVHRSRVEDPRLAVPLPFVSNIRIKLWPVLWGAAASICLIILPVLYLRKLLTRRRWSLRTLLAAPLICGLIIVFLTIRPPAAVAESFAYHPYVARLNAALGSLPLVLFPAMIIVLLRRKRWKQAAFWLLVPFILGLAIAGVVIGIDARTLEPDERYKWSGLHVPFVLGLLLTGWIALFVYFAILPISRGCTRVAHRIGRTDNAPGNVAIDG